MYASVWGSGIHKSDPARPWPPVEMSPKYVKTLALAYKTWLQWDGKQFTDSTDTVTFQLQIFEGVRGGNPIYAQMIYADVEQPRADGGGSATIGYQDGGAGFNSVQWSFNLSGAVSNGTVLSLIPEPASLALIAIGAWVSHRRR